MADGLAKTLAGVLGFGLCKTALGVAYLTAMGSVFSNVGFISELSFMTPMLRLACHGVSDRARGAQRASFAWITQAISCRARVVPRVSLWWCEFAPWSSRGRSRSCLRLTLRLLLYGSQYRVARCALR